MKKYILLTLTIYISGCATPAPYLYEQQCAKQGMLLRGVDSASGSGLYITPNGRLGTATMYGSTVRCDVPKSEEESCEVSRINRTTAPIDKYNERMGAKVTLNTLGYLFFIIPGLAIWSSYEKDKHAATTESIEAYVKTKNDCRFPSSESLNKP